jgi:hypothetical protein
VSAPGANAVTLALRGAVITIILFLTEEYVPLLLYNQLSGSVKNRKNVNYRTRRPTVLRNKFLVSDFSGPAKLFLIENQIVTYYRSSSRH